MKLETLQFESMVISGQPFPLVLDIDIMGRYTMKFAVTLEEDEDGFIVVSCPVLPGCHSQGRTREEAISNITEAIRGYIASMRKHGETILVNDVEEVEVAV